MPELPEVETTVRGLRKNVIGLKIKNVWTDLSTKDKRQRENVANPLYFKFFKKEVTGQKIISTERRAKNILINLNNGKTILIHMKMTGHLLYGKYINPSLSKGRVGVRWIPQDTEGPLGDPFNRFVHVIFNFTNGKSLAFSDARKFGKITLVDTNKIHESKHLNNIGPEPLDPKFTITNFKLRINKKINGKIKTVLMDQSILAGIGNIYSDEILWKAGVHPEKMARKTKEKELEKIFKAMKEILKKGIYFGGDSMSDYRNIDGLPGKFQLKHKVYKKAGKRCEKKGCLGIILRKKINGRSAHFCPVHQK